MSANILTVLISSADHSRAGGSGPLCSGGRHCHIVPVPLLQPLQHSLFMVGWDKRRRHLQTLTSSSCPRNPLVFELITCQLAVLALQLRWGPAHSERGGADALAGHTLGGSRRFLKWTRTMVGTLAKSLGGTFF